MTTEDPFERAAKHEQLEELRRERMRARLRKRAHRGTEGAGKAFRVFFLPYAVWGLLRATDHTWGSPSTSKAVIRFFFGSGFWFAALTVWVLMLFWVWTIGGGDD